MNSTGTAKSPRLVLYQWHSTSPRDFGVFLMPAATPLLPGARGMDGLVHHRRGRAGSIATGHSLQRGCVRFSPIRVGMRPRVDRRAPRSPRSPRQRSARPPGADPGGSALRTDGRAMVEPSGVGIMHPTPAETAHHRPTWADQLPGLKTPPSRDDTMRKVQ
jgi:hypothetical protein